MKYIIFILLLLSYPFLCNAQTPNYCDLLHLTFRNEVFLKLFKVDTTYTRTIVIIDRGEYFKDCNGIKFNNCKNSFVVSTTRPLDSTQLYYKCFGVINEPENKKVYSMGIDNYLGNIYVGVYFIQKNGKWVIDHFDSDSPNPFFSNSPENIKATEEANQKLHEH